MFLYPVGRAYALIQTDCYSFPLMHILPSFHLFMCTSYRPVLQIRPTLSNFFEIYSTLSQRLTIGATVALFSYKKFFSSLQFFKKSHRTIMLLSISFGLQIYKNYLDYANNYDFLYFKNSS
jgi:hypothetical protein